MGHHSISMGEGGVLGTDKLFSNYVLRTVFEMNYLFHAEYARNDLFQKSSSPPRILHGCTLINFVTCVLSFILNPSNFQSHDIVDRRSEGQFQATKITIK